jgi:hypothetical protein
MEKTVNQRLYPMLQDMGEACETIVNGIVCSRHSTRYLSEEEEFQLYILADKWRKNYENDKTTTINGMIEELNKK